MSFVGGGSFSTPIDILGFPGFQGQIYYGGGAYGVGSGSWQGEYGWSAPRWIVDLSLGDGWFNRLPTIPSLLGVPALVSEAGVITEGSFPLEIDLRDPPPHESELPGLDMHDVPQSAKEEADKAWFDAMFPGKGWVRPGTPHIPVAPVAQSVQIEEDDEVGWISDVYDVVDTAAGGWLPGGVPVGSSLPATIGNQLYTPTPTFPTPPTVPVGGAIMPVTGCEEDPYKGMVWKRVCGQFKWVKQKRRRRRSLVTQTDLRGLAALKGVLGQGKAFEVWIATHS